MGTVNQYKLITWLDPLGTKTSSINHASTFSAAVPLQPSAPTAKNEGGRECANVCASLCGRVDTGGVQGGWLLIFHRQKVMSTIVTWYRLLILDHKRTQCLSLVITSTPCSVRSFSYFTEIYLRAKLLSHTRIVCFLSFLPCLLLLLLFLHLLLILFLLSHTVPRSNWATLHYCFLIS